ncbi:MAG: radical SAM protein [Candidatus Hydrogenedentota bacterium]
MRIRPFSVLKSKLNKKRIPLFISLEITNKCNLHCIHCYIPPDKRNLFMTLDRVKNVIEQVYEAGTLEVVITGGEPLMHKDILKILDYIIQEKKMNVILFTNAVLLTPQLIDKLKEYPYFSLDITIYGFTGKTYLNVTGKEVRDIVFNNIILSKNKGLKLNLKMQLLKENYKEFEAVLDFSKKLGCPFRYSHFISPDWNGNKKIQKHLLAKSQLKSIINITGDLVEYKDCAKIIESEVKKTSCSLAKSTAGITAAGDLLPCISMRLKTGNVFKKRFGMLWNDNEKLKELADFSLTETRCFAKCKLKTDCFICPGLAHSDNNGDFRKPFKQSCLFTKLRYER